MTKETQAELIARLRDNLASLSQSLIDRTAELQDARDKLAASFAENIAYANTRIDRMGEAKPYKLIAITAALAFVAGAVLL